MIGPNTAPVGDDVTDDRNTVAADLRISNPIAAISAPFTAARSTTFSLGSLAITHRNTSQLAAIDSTMATAVSPARAQPYSASPISSRTYSPAPTPSAVSPNEITSASPRPSRASRSL